MLLVYPALVFSDGDILWECIEERTGNEIYSCILPVGKPACDVITPILAGREAELVQRTDLRVIIAHLTATGIPYDDAVALAKSEDSKDEAAADPS